MDGNGKTPVNIQVQRCVKVKIGISRQVQRCAKVKIEISKQVQRCTFPETKI